MARKEVMTVETALETFLSESVDVCAKYAAELKGVEEIDKENLSETYSGMLLLCAAIVRKSSSFTETPIVMMANLMLAYSGVSVVDVMSGKFGTTLLDEMSGLTVDDGIGSYEGKPS
jgi:hypothetical protein